MSNNNSRNIYNTTGRANGSSGGHGSGDNEEMEMLLGQSNASAHQMGNNHSTTIDNDNDMSPGNSQQHLQRQQFLQQIRRDAESTRINMEAYTSNITENSSGENEDIDDRQRVINAYAMLRENSSGENVDINERRRVINVFAMLREARHQLNRSQSLRDHHHVPTTARNGVGENHTANTHARSWRENLCDVLSSPVTPRTEVLRAIFQSASTSSGNIRYNSLPTNDVQPEEQSHILLNHQNANQNDHELQQHSLRSHGLETQTTSSSALRLSRQNLRLTDDRTLNDSSASSSQSPAVDSSIDNNTPVGGGVGDANRRQSNPATSNPNGGRLPQRQTSATGSTTAPTIDMVDDADTNTVGEMIVKIVNHFVHYLPFVSIIFVKFIHDHLLGILDLLLLHGVVYQINKSLKEQVAKLNQKSYAVLIRDLILLICVITYRFILSTSSPDPFGLLINPPGATISLDFTSTHKTEISKDMPTDMGLNQLSDSKHSIHEVPSPPTANPLNSSTISVTKTLSLGALLYYVAVNDLILKLLTQLIKIIVTLLPIKVIRHKSRARLYALMEYISHFYRALVPMRQWLTFLFESYTGLEVISGILFSAFYLGAKGFEFVERGKSLKKALINFVRNMDYDRKPTKDELEAAGTVCPICHDSYTTPVVLECSHIFCDNCVNTWFKREQTCPMCRAKVSEDRKWQDGATTYFYQLC